MALFQIGPRPLRRAAMLLIAVVFVGVAGTIVAVRHRQPNRAADAPPGDSAKPLRDALEGDTVDRDAALATLADLVLAGRLPPVTVSAVADRALIAQASDEPWDPAWGTFVESAHAAGRLDRDRWAAYARQSARFTLVDLNGLAEAKGRTAVPRAFAYRGESARLYAAGEPARLAGAQFYGTVALGDVSIDHVAVAPTITGSAADPALVSFSGRQRPTDPAVTAAMVDLTAGITGPLSIGPHVVTATARVTLYDAGAGLGSRSGPLVAFDRAVVGPLAIGARPTFEVDPADRAAMAAALRDVSATVDARGTMTVRGRLSSPHARVSCRVLLRPAGAERDAGTVLLAEPPAAAGAVLVGDVPPLTRRSMPGPIPVDQLAVPADQSSAFAVQGFVPYARRADRVDLTFQPDANGPAGNVDPAPIWGEPIVLRDVPLARLPWQPSDLQTGPVHRSAMAASIKDLRVVIDPRRTLTVAGSIARPPVRGRFHVVVRSADGLLAGRVAAAAVAVEGSPGVTKPFAVTARLDDDEATRVDVTFEPDLDPPVDRAVTAVPIWGEPIVVRDVPLSHGD